MESKGFSVGDALKLGWREMKKHWLFFSSFMLIMLVLPIAFMVGVIGPYLYLYPHITTTHGVAVVVIGLILIVLECIMVLGLIKSALHAVRGESLQFRDLYGEAKKVVSYIVAHILYGLVLLMPYVVFVVLPAVILSWLGVDEKIIGMWSAYTLGIAYIVVLMLMAKYIFYPFAIVDKGVGPIEALKISNKLTDGCKWDVLLLYFGIGIAIYLGFLFFGIGLLFAIPLGFIAMATVYNRLTEQ